MNNAALITMLLSDYVHPKIAMLLISIKRTIQHFIEQLTLRTQGGGTHTL
jgi:hypothetical protein